MDGNYLKKYIFWKIVIKYYYNAIKKLYLNPIILNNSDFSYFIFFNCSMDFNIIKTTD